jgi:hypothetical protein
MQKLPDDILLQMLSHSDLSSVKRFAITSKSMNQLTNDNQVWQPKIQRNIHNYKESFIIKYNWEHLERVLELDSEPTIAEEFVLNQTLPKRLKPSETRKYFSCIADETTLGISMKKNRIVQFSNALLDLSKTKPKFENLPHSSEDFCAKTYSSDLVVLAYGYDESSWNQEAQTQVWDVSLKKIVGRIPILVYDLEAASMCQDEIVTVKRASDGFCVELWQVHDLTSPEWTYMLEPFDVVGLSVVYRNGYVAVLFQKMTDQSILVLLNSVGEHVKTIDCGISVSFRCRCLEMTDFHLIATFHSKLTSKILLFAIPEFLEPKIIELQKKKYELQNHLPFGVAISEDSRFLLLNNMKAHIVDSKVVGKTSMLHIYDLLEFSVKKFIVDNSNRQLIRNGSRGSKNCWCIAVEGEDVQVLFIRSPND